MQKELTKVAGNSSFLLTFIWYAFLIAAGLYVLGFLEKVVVASNAGAELRANKKLVKYMNEKGRKLKLESELDSEKHSLEKMTKDVDQCKKSVKDLEKDPLIEKLKPSIEIIENAKKDEGLMKNLELRQKLLEYWKLTYRWISQHGFRRMYRSLEKVGHTSFVRDVPTFEELEWLDGEFIAKEGNPLSYPEEMLKSNLEQLQEKQILFYSSASKSDPLTFYFSSFGEKNIQQLSEEDFNKAKEKLNVLKQSNINDYNEDEDFKEDFDKLSCRLERFKEDFENFKKAKEKLNEIRVLKKICCKEIFGDDVELRIKEIVEAVEKIDAENHCAVPLEFDIVEFKLGLEKGQEYYRYVFTRKDFKKIEDFISKVCHEMGIANEEQRIEDLERKLESENSYGEELKKSILNMEESIKKINKKLESEKDAKQRIEYLNKKQNEVTENLFQFTFPGKYTFFY